MRTITGKNAIVTGAASGIGRAIALRLAAEGANICALDIDDYGLFQIVTDVKQAGVRAIGRLCDNRQPQEISAAVEHVLQRWGGVDILVNNAGIAYYGEFCLMSADHCEQIIDVNLRAPIEFIRLLLPVFRQSGDAHVVNVASVFGMIGYPQASVYSATKHALVGLTEALRGEYGRRGIGFTAVCPGFVDTGLFDSAMRGVDRQTNKQAPRWMMTSPEKVADRTIKAIYRNRPVEYVQTYARLAPIGKRMFYGLIDRLHHLSKRKLPVVRHFVRHETPDQSTRRAA